MQKPIGGPMPKAYTVTLTADELDAAYVGLLLVVSDCHYTEAMREAAARAKQRLNVSLWEGKDGSAVTPLLDQGS